MSLLAAASYLPTRLSPSLLASLGLAQPAPEGRAGLPRVRLILAVFKTLKQKNPSLLFTGQAGFKPATLSKVVAPRRLSDCPGG